MKYKCTQYKYTQTQHKYNTNTHKLKYSPRYAATVYNVTHLYNPASGLKDKYKKNIYTTHVFLVTTT